MSAEPKGFDLMIKLLTQTHSAVSKYDETLVGEYKTLAETFNADRSRTMGMSTALKLYLELSGHMLQSKPKMLEIYKAHIAEMRRPGVTREDESFAHEAARIMMGSAMDSIIKKLESGESISVTMVADGEKLALPFPLDRDNFAKGLREGLDWLNELIHEGKAEPAPSPLAPPPGYKLN